MLLLATLIQLYTFILIGAVIVSWIPMDPDHPVKRTLYMLTEPVLAPIRKLLPDMGGLDLSPLIALLILQLLHGALIR